jgi:hypothetical protein
VGLGDLSIDIFLELQDKKDSSILYLVDYIAYGLHLWCNIRILTQLRTIYEYVELHMLSHRHAMTSGSHQFGATTSLSVVDAT